MELSPQSTQEVQKLLNGLPIRSGELIVGALDAAAKKTLSILVKHSARLLQIKGGSQADEFRKLFKAEQAVETETALASAPAAATPARRNWKLEKLTCKSIRGIAPSGERFEFNFGSRSILIFGPNGSGKSSLASAVVWALTGNMATDSENPSPTASLYRLTDSAKACEWPVIRTLPNTISEATSPTDDCFAQVELRDDAGNAIHFRRELVAGLTSSIDLLTWMPCKSLEEFGISALDLQLSLTAPSTFGRKAIETAEDTRSLLSMMLGYDDLEALGEMASSVARNRTALFNSEAKGLTTSLSDVVARIQSQIDILPEDSEPRRLLTVLAGKEPITSADITITDTSFAALVTTAEQALATVLGISDAALPPKLADDLTVLLTDLESGTRSVFPALDDVSPAQLLEAETAGEALQKLSALKERVRVLLEQMATKISARYQWWTKEVAPGSKATLLLRAASFYDPNTDTCPVCEKEIADETLSADLLRLKSEDQAIAQEIKAFFSDLTEEIKECFSDAQFAAGKTPFIEEVRFDWDKFKERLGKIGLATLIVPFDTPIKEQIEASCQTATWESPNLFLSGVLPPFMAAATTFNATLAQAGRILVLMDWSCGSHSSASDFFKTMLCSTDESSLLSHLASGRQAAADVRPLAAIRENLKGLLVKVQGIEGLAEETAILSTLKAPLDELKNLSKYAASEVARIFERIQEKTVGNWKLLYPEESMGITPFGLSLKKGKDKTVEGLISGSDYKAPLQHFANAGWQRAAALSFYFAMLDHHPKGLGFFLLDDPILSLDDEHRELWACNLLSPTFSAFQVVLATHQRQFLKTCGYHFEPQCTFELIPRTRKRAISWLPGHYLLRATANLAHDWSNTPNIMRKYREGIVPALEPYSPVPFLVPGNLQNSLDNYRGLGRSSPLTYKEINVKICNILAEPAIATVLDEGSHGPTEANVTHAMVSACLDRLLVCDRMLREEVGRLEEQRARAMRSTVVHSNILPFPSVPPTASWNEEVEIEILGGAAARSGHYVVELAEEQTTVALSSGSAVLVTGDSLDPVAKNGQWVLLGADLGEDESGALAAVVTPEGRYLRRVWPDRERWILQSVNPVEPLKTISVAKLSASARRIIGVVYHPETYVTSASPEEWTPHGRGVSAELESANAINVLGDSLAPIAFTGQKVLVGQPLASLSAIMQGGLAVVETTSAVGTVIKRVFTQGSNFVLLSPNPVDAIAPILLPNSEVLRIWPMRGVLFETHESVS